LVELHENRRGFALEVRDILTEPLAQNGLGVEDVAIFTLDQTDKNQLDPNNIFDAQGLRQITAQTSARMQEPNEIERNTEVAIKGKDVEAVKLKLELADLERERLVEEARRGKEVAVIRALHEVEVAERLAQATLREGEAAAKVADLARQAENVLAPKLIYREIALRLIEQFPQIARELMEPARHIDSIRVLDVNGLRGDGAGEAGDGADPAGRVFEALLGTGAALPLLRELLAFGRDRGLLEGLEESLPGQVRRLVKRRPEATSS
jgi:uncharacterized membrane protein YqiK